MIWVAVYVIDMDAGVDGLLAHDHVTGPTVAGAFDGLGYLILDLERDAHNEVSRRSLRRRPARPVVSVLPPNAVVNGLPPYGSASNTDQPKVIDRPPAEDAAPYREKLRTITFARVPGGGRG